jgi:serine protease Do
MGAMVAGATYADTPGAGTQPATVRGPDVPSAALGTSTPRTVADLLAIQQTVESVAKKVRVCTVALQIGHAQGSGVIISNDGYILTAGHVVQKPGQHVIVTLADGRQLSGKTLGANTGIDSGLVKITEPGDWPHVEMGHSGDLTPGQFCLAMGHPNGYRRDRPPVLRLGRVIESSSRVIYTDCTLVAGDSGGPLFDLAGRVVGIHSRIGDATFANLHVPVDTFRLSWERLAAGDVWGAPLPPGSPMLGVYTEDAPGGCLVHGLVKDSPAEKAGLHPGDMILRFDGHSVDGVDTLTEQIGKHKAGDTVTVELRRGEEILQFNVTLAKRG